MINMESLRRKLRMMEAKPRTGNFYQLPPWGELLEVRIIFPEPIPNYNAAMPIEMLLERLPEGYHVFVIVQDVPDKGRA